MSSTVRSSSDRSTSTTRDEEGGGGEGDGGRGGGSCSCQDCGNKAKRDCGFMRCRSCCKNRGFDCPTHVKSTWIPIARRRQILNERLSFSVPAGRFCPYISPHWITTPNPQNYYSSSSSGGVEGIRRFPAEVNSLASFRCVRVSNARSEDNNVVAAGQVAYQTSVIIAGHVFNGILYDEGPIEGFRGSGDHQASSSEAHHQHHPHDLPLSSNATAATGGSTGDAAVAAAYSGSAIHQFPFYASPPPYGTFMPGMHFFPHPRPN